MYVHVYGSVNDAGSVADRDRFDDTASERPEPSGCRDVVAVTSRRAGAGMWTFELGRGLADQAAGSDVRHEVALVGAVTATLAVTITTTLMMVATAVWSLAISGVISLPDAHARRRGHRERSPGTTARYSYSTGSAATPNGMRSLARRTATAVVQLQQAGGRLLT